MRIKGTYLAAMSAATSFALVLACSTTVRVRGGEHTPIVGEAEVELTMKAGQPATVEAGATETVPPGTCLRLTFTGKGGAALGTAETSAGGPPVPVPPGTEDVTVSPCAPDDPADHQADGKKKPTRGSRGGEEDLAVFSTYFYRTVPVTARTDSRFVDFTVTAADRAAADSLAGEFLASPIGATPPAGLETYGYLAVHLRRDGSARLSMISRFDPTSARARWNRASHLVGPGRELSANGWWAWVAIVPAPDVLAENSIEFSLESRDRKVGLSVSVEGRL